MRDYKKELNDLPKKHDFFVGIDSDGCVFDSMELKHKECLCPAFIKHFELQTASRYAREVWEFVTLYSKTRGCNRFLALQHARDLMKKREVFAERKVSIPELMSLDSWVEEETRLCNQVLEVKVRESGDADLAACLAWSEEVNVRIKEMVRGVGPFSRVLPFLEDMDGQADVIVVSESPLEVLDREWKELGLFRFVSYIAGHEAGTKAERLRHATAGKYDQDKVLMIGDAPCDYAAAVANNALFFPVIPGDEEASWDLFRSEGFVRFLEGTYSGDYQESRLAAFEMALPDYPPWERF